MAGWRTHFNNTVLTVWSAPNYVYRCGNAATVCLFNPAIEPYRLVAFDKSDKQEHLAKASLAEYFM